MKKTTPPVVAVIGHSGSGKTTFLEKLIPELTRRGLKVGSIKHDVHGFEMDRPGKDSWRHKHAGASATIISSPHQIGMVMDVEYDHQPDELLSLFNGMDIILTEGYKRSRIPKLEIFRAETTPEPLCKNDEKLIALITDAQIDLNVPIFSTTAVKKVADFLIEQFNLIHIRQ
ncbi:MAG: molybdopterin-guanine dinucleotide biosynthesis protein B [Desulfobacterales bacterium]